MKGLQQTVFKLLAVLILIGAMAGAWISWQRYHVEAAAQTVEMVYDYNNILDSAAVEGLHGLHSQHTRGEPLNSG